jgi:hypothetical protein
MVYVQLGKMAPAELAALGARAAQIRAGLDAL